MRALGSLCKDVRRAVACKGDDSPTKPSLATLPGAVQIRIETACHSRGRKEVSEHADIAIIFGATAAPHERASGLVRQGSDEHPFRKWCSCVDFMFRVAAQ